MMMMMMSCYVSSSIAQKKEHCDCRRGGRKAFSRRISLSGAASIEDEKLYEETNDTECC